MYLFGHRLNITASIGFAIIAVNLIAVLFAPWIAPYDQADIVGDVWDPPSAAAWLGLDNLGRDMFSRIVHGARLSVTMAVVATLLSYVIGCSLGFLAAVMGGWVDSLISRLVDVLLAIPTLIFALAILTVFQGVITLIVVIAILNATRVYRVSRAIAMDVVALDYVEVARLRGEKLGWIVVQEILPNALPPLAAEFGLRFCFTLLFIATLSFLGFGVQPPQADWGVMVRENALIIGFGGIAPLLPAAAIALLTVGVNLVVDWFLSFGAAHGDVVQ